MLLLDEPLRALDLKLRKQMQFVLVRIQREVGTTMGSVAAVADAVTLRRCRTPSES